MASCRGDIEGAKFTPDRKRYASVTFERPSTYQTYVFPGCNERTPAEGYW